MVPLNLFAITSYLTVLRALAPEFRSTREIREDLWDFARELEVLATKMRGEGLARTRPFLVPNNTRFERTTAELRS